MGRNGVITAASAVLLLFTGLAFAQAPGQPAGPPGQQTGIVVKEGTTTKATAANNLGFNNTTFAITCTGTACTITNTTDLDDVAGATAASKTYLIGTSSTLRPSSTGVIEANEFSSSCNGSTDCGITFTQQSSNASVPGTNKCVIYCKTDDSCFKLCNGESAPGTQLVDPSITKIKTADETMNGTSIDASVLQDDDHFTWTVEANTNYTINGVLLISVASAAPDFKFNFVEPTSATFRIGFLSVGSADAGHNIQSDTDTGIIPLPNSTEQVVLINGLVFVSSNAGTFKMQWAMNTDTNVDLTVLKGSWLTLRKVT